MILICNGIYKMAIRLNSGDSSAVFVQKAFDPMGITFYVTRHSEGVNNVGKVFDTHPEGLCGLTPLGKTQAMEIERVSVEKHFAVSSTILRAKETKDLYCERHSDVVDLGEMDLLAEPLFMHGQTWSIERVKDLNATHYQTPYATATPTGTPTESGYSYYSRTIAVLTIIRDTVRALSKNGIVNIFGHHNTSQLVQNIASGAPFATELSVPMSLPIKINFVQHPPMTFLHPQSKFLSFKISSSQIAAESRFTAIMQQIFQALPWLSKIDAYHCDDASGPNICVELTKRYCTRPLTVEKFDQLRQHCVDKHGATPIVLPPKGHLRIVVGTYAGYSGRPVEGATHYGLSAPNGKLQATWRSGDALETYPAVGFEPVVVTTIPTDQLGIVMMEAVANQQETFTAMDSDGVTFTICTETRGAK